MTHKLTYDEALDFFSYLYCGTHNIPGQIKEYPYPGEGGWSVCHYGDLCTFDGDLLTNLVFLAHDKQMRAGIEQGGPRSVKIFITKRTCREGKYWEMHPTMETALAQWRKFNRILLEDK